MSSESNQKQGFWRSPAGLAVCVFLLIAGVFLWLEHRAHILGVLPLLLPLLICVGLHLFLHRGHGDHGSHDHRSDRDVR